MIEARREQPTMESLGSGMGEARLVSDWQTSTDSESNIGLNEESRSQEQASAPNVGESDVICGRTKLAFGHAGNRFFRELVQSFRSEYQGTTSRKQKNEIVQKITDIISGRRGRFMKFCEQDDTWIPLVEAQRYDKVSHALRSAQFSVKDKRKPKSLNRKLPALKPSEEREFTVRSDVVGDWSATLFDLMGDFLYDFPEEPLEGQHGQRVEKDDMAPLDVLTSPALDDHMVEILRKTKFH